MDKIKRSAMSIIDIFKKKPVTLCGVKAGPPTGNVGLDLINGIIGDCGQPAGNEQCSVCGIPLCDDCVWFLNGKSVCPQHVLGGSEVQS